MKTAPQCGSALCLAAGLLLSTGCIRTISPSLVILCDSPCVLTMEYGDQAPPSEHRIDGSMIIRRNAGSSLPVPSRIALHDTHGQPICSMEGPDFSDRFRDAPRHRNKDCALLLSPDGACWLTREEFLKEAETVDRLREEAQRRRQQEEERRRQEWLARELKARYGH
jgi:hypothetical protein